MTDEPLGAALARLDRAVGRLEGALGSRTRRSDDAARSLAALQTRHDRLRGEVDAAIGRLDALIAGEG